MRVLIVAFICFSTLGFLASAQTPAAQVAISGSASAQALAAPAAPFVTVSQDLVVKDPVFVPPTWLQDLVLTAENLPTVGPILVKILQYGAVLVTILTALCGFLLVVLKSLSSIASFANLANLAAKVQAINDSKILYYLKYLSAFNAQKPKAAADQKTA